MPVVYFVGTMNTTISVSIPNDLKQEAQRAVDAGVYPSLSHIVSIGIRQVLPKTKRRVTRRLTVNGFTPEFERQVLLAEKEPLDQALEWDGKGSFTKFVLKNSKRIHKT